MIDISGDYVISGGKSAGIDGEDLYGNIKLADSKQNVFQSGDGYAGIQFGDNTQLVIKETANGMGMLAAESRISDDDMAKEMMNFAKASILTEAAQSMLAQERQNPNQVTELLQGI